MLTLPVVGTTRGDAQVVVPQEPDADAILNRLRNFTSLPTGLPQLVQPATVRIAVHDGSGTSGNGKELLDDMVAHGFVAAGPATVADRSDYPLTQIRYPAGNASKALTAAVFLGTKNVVEARPGEVAGHDAAFTVGDRGGPRRSRHRRSARGLSGMTRPHGADPPVPRSDGRARYRWYFA